jgi:dipeptidyl aminopeptidase/acylaminoacyl peptidase
VSERELENRLRAVRLPGEEEALARTWTVVRAAFDARDAVPRPARRLRAVLVLAALAAVVLAVLSPPGRAVLGSLRETVGIERSQPALFSLPAPGTLVVASPEGGAWVAREDGSKRRLGAYREASWSPFGRFVVVAGENELAALEPDGTVRWKLSRPGVRFVRWAGSRTDTRVAYLSGSDLRLVAGDGTEDRLLAAGVEPVAPAWRPGGFELAYARGGRVVALDTRTGSRLWTRPAADVRSLEWSPRGESLLVRRARSLRVLDAGGRVRFELLRPDLAAPVVAAAWSPDGRSLAFVQRTAGQSALWLIPRLDPDAAAARRVFAGAGAFTGLAWSPDGRWLLLAWRDADQWLFLRVTGGRGVRAVSGIGGQFGGGFPALGGWCC